MVLFSLFVGPADGAVEGSVAFAFIERVAFEAFLVEEVVYDLVCGYVSPKLVYRVELAWSIQFPRDAASWYAWFPRTLFDSFKSFAAASGVVHPSMTSFSRSTLLRRHASITSSEGLAPWEYVSICKDDVVASLSMEMEAVS